MSVIAIMDKELGRSAVEFNRDLREIQTQVEDEAKAYNEMPQEGKRKCLDTLDETIQTLQRIKRDLKEAHTKLPNANEVQVEFNAEPYKTATFTKEEFVKSFELINARRRGPVIPIPNIVNVRMEDNFQLDANKHLQPVRMCFVKFTTADEKDMVLGLRELQTTFQYNGEKRSSNIKLIEPTQTPEVHETLRCIGKLVTRLESINKELKHIGTTREYGTVPVLNREFCDQQTYREYLAKSKAQRSTGASLDHHSYAPLASMKPADTASLNARIKALYDEECDIVIQLREYQLNGIEFEFKTHAASRH